MATQINCSRRRAGEVRRKKILTFVETYSKENGYPPSYRDIAWSIGVRSTNTVQYHLRKLRDEGLIAWVRNSPRSLWVVDPAHEPQVVIDWPQTARSGT